MTDDMIIEDIVPQDWTTSDEIIKVPGPGRRPQRIPLGVGEYTGDSEST